MSMERRGRIAGRWFKRWYAYFAFSFLLGTCLSKLHAYGPDEVATSIEPLLDGVCLVLSVAGIAVSFAHGVRNTQSDPAE